MTQKLIVSVEASSNCLDMTVQDAFAHVLDLFQLVSESDPGAQGLVVWRLVSATMNSPFTVTAEAVAARPGVIVERIAKQQKRAFRDNYKALKAGYVPQAWASPKARETVSKLLARNRNGIGSTRIDEGLKSEAPLIITSDDATVAAMALAGSSVPPHSTKNQLGSVEGTLLQAGLHFGQPAIQLVDRKTKRLIWCVVPEAIQHEFSQKTTVEDVWKGSRVVVRGAVQYAADGSISRVIATDLRRIETRQVSEEAIADKNFTQGLGVTEYLERLREGTLG